MHFRIFYCTSQYHKHDTIKYFDIFDPGQYRKSTLSNVSDFNIKIHDRFIKI